MANYGSNGVDVSNDLGADDIFAEYMKMMESRNDFLDSFEEELSGFQRFAENAAQIRLLNTKLKGELKKVTLIFIPDTTAIIARH
eukprot:TRINITY_DN16089_c0_g1_i1.p1 TRINITY_DN16089_c0_g1~~TRINITY_DN16089_c0_g1_i1.p1  ORF type:complete len:85 (-),score=17.31 TRINITY_DN16089_c0_g1_i1:61-315(-)